MSVLVSNVVDVLFESDVLVSNVVDVLSEI